MNEKSIKKYAIEGKEFDDLYQHYRNIWITKTAVFICIIAILTACAWIFINWAIGLIISIYAIGMVVGVITTKDADIETIKSKFYNLQKEYGISE